MQAASTSCLARERQLRPDGCVFTQPASVLERPAVPLLGFGLPWDEGLGHPRVAPCSGDERKIPPWGSQLAGSCPP